MLLPQLQKCLYTWVRLLRSATVGILRANDLGSMASVNSLLTFPKLYSIVVAAILWRFPWHGERIVSCCDNQAIIHIIRKGHPNI